MSRYAEICELTMDHQFIHYRSVVAVKGAFLNQPYDVPRICNGALLNQPCGVSRICYEAFMNQPYGVPRICYVLSPTVTSSRLIKLPHWAMIDDHVPCGVPRETTTWPTHQGPLPYYHLDIEDHPRGSRSHHKTHKSIIQFQPNRKQ